MNFAFPLTARIICFADHDEVHLQTGKRPGIEKANEAAGATGGRVVMSSVEGEDPCDLFVRCGAKAVREILDAPTMAPMDAKPNDDTKTNVLEADGRTAFPAEVMTGLAGDFAQLYSGHLEAPKHFFFMSFLACLGTLVANRVTLDSELAPQARLFVLLLGESADDRKSTAITKTVDFFKGTTVEFPVCWGVGSAEGLQKRMEKAKQLLLAFDEFRQFVSKCKIEASVLLPCVNTLFESNRYESRTKQSDVTLENVYLSVLAASTIATYENTWSSQFTDIGFNNRLWLVTGGARRRFSIPPAIPEEARYDLKRRLSRVLQHAEDHRRLKIHPAARELYHNWYMNVRRSVHTKRLDTYAMRFMILLAINDLLSEVDEDTVRKVIALCDHQYYVRLLHDPVDADNAVARMEEKIRRVLTAKRLLTERDIKRHVHVNQKGLWLYNSAKANLQRAGELGFNRTDKKFFLKGEKG